MQSICVFCGSRPGKHPGYMTLARDLGELLARRKLTVVFGGGRVGMMGAVAEAALNAGGRVIGVIPQLLIDKEVAHSGLSELRVVTTMSERKLLMGSLSDAFITLPGGTGTMDELFEVWSWTQLGLHTKPSGLLNYDGYYDSLIRYIDHTVEEGFLPPQHRASLIVDTDMTRLVDKLLAAS